MINGKYFVIPIDNYKICILYRYLSLKLFEKCAVHTMYIILKRILLYLLIIKIPIFTIITHCKSRD